MPKKEPLLKKPKTPVIEKKNEVKAPDPEEPLNIAEDDSNLIPEDEPFEDLPPYEKPAPGEGP